MIRTYQPEDKQALIDLLRLNTPKYFAAEEEKDFVQYLAQHGEEHFVWEENGRVLGCAGCNWYPDSNEGRVAWFIVDPQTQGRGIGKNLLNYCLDQLKKNPATRKIIVRTSQFAEGFFAKGGFETERHEKDFWSPGYDLVYMTMEW